MAFAEERRRFNQKGMAVKQLRLTRHHFRAISAAASVFRLRFTSTHANAQASGKANIPSELVLSASSNNVKGKMRFFLHRCSEVREKAQFYSCD